MNEFVLDQLIKEAMETGFTHAAFLDPDTIVLREEVRDMCRRNTCGQFGKNWCCPPGVGSLEDCRKKIQQFHKGLLVQTVGMLEDSLDVETMLETEQVHKGNLELLREKLEKKFPGMLTIGSGTCRRCRECSYPDAPCRFPEKTFGSMEAYGMLVTDVCKANDLAYYYGPNTIAYTSCFLMI